MRLEFNALTKNHTWDLVPRGSHMKVIGCQWIYKTKTKLGGVLDKYKARVTTLLWVIISQRESISLKSSLQ